ELSSLLERVAKAPAVQKEEADARAASARAERERALVRPMLTLDLGLEAFDPSLPATNYRAQLGIELPILNQRGPYIEREGSAAVAATWRARYEAHALTTDLIVAYRNFQGDSARRDTLSNAVLPAAEQAARATQESYSLGHASLEAVLDAERVWLETKKAPLDADAARAHAWVGREHALGGPWRGFSRSPVRAWPS